MSEREPDFRPGRQSSVSAVVVLVLIAIAAGAGWWYWSQRNAAAPLPPPSATAPAVPDAPPPAPPVAATGPQNPVDALAEPDAVLPALGDSDAQAKKALTDLLGAQRVATLLNVDGFVRRVVATIDNLPRAQAPSRMWPMQPAPERFTVEGGAERTTIGEANATRYAAFTRMVEAVDAERAASLYARFYPLFQQAYEELGYPGRYFNDRLVAVIDHLLDTPEPTGPVAVHLTEVRGEFTAERPWTRYEYADPALESMSSGQKLMVRVGLANER
ncbi:MAG TPA: DUF3014 domain-containing protein, partial [Variovorax sp.]